MKIKAILPLANKTVVENIVGTIDKIEKPIINKPGSKDKTRQRVLLKDDTADIDVLVWGGNYTNDIVGKTIAINSAMVSEFQGKKRLTAGRPSIKEKTSQNYIAKDKIIFDLSKLLVKCFDAVYKQLKTEGYTDIPVQEVEKMGATIFLTIKDMLFAKWGKNAPAKDLKDLI